MVLYVLINLFLKKENYYLYLDHRIFELISTLNQFSLLWQMMIRIVSMFLFFIRLNEKTKAKRKEQQL